MSDQPDRLTIENSVERDVNEATDYLCDECSVAEDGGVEVWHERADLPHPPWLVTAASAGSRDRARRRR
jgi:hypothetical protein